MAELYDCMDYSKTIVSQSERLHHDSAKCGYVDIFRGRGNHCYLSARQAPLSCDCWWVQLVRSILWWSRKRTLIMWPFFILGERLWDFFFIQPSLTCRKKGAAVMWTGTSSVWNMLVCFVADVRSQLSSAGAFVHMTLLPSAKMTKANCVSTGEKPVSWYSGLCRGSVGSGLLGLRSERTFSPLHILTFELAALKIPNWVQTDWVLNLIRIVNFLSFCSSGASELAQRWPQIVFYRSKRKKICGSCGICCILGTLKMSRCVFVCVRVCVRVFVCVRIWGSTEASVPLCNTLVFVTLIITWMREALQRD